MPLIRTPYTLISSTRNKIRDELINLFLLENPGTGKGVNCSKYEYTVESFSGYSIVLNRPARFNKGFDFTVSIPTANYLFKKTNRYHTPSHDDIILALTYSQANYPTQYQSVKQHLHDAYNCINASFASGSPLGYFSDYNNNLHPIEIIILASKWLFIEQDITYWNWSGRAMLWNELVKKNLV
jgi:hypothetical protein